MHPRDKARKYAAELKNRKDSFGKPLTDNQINFRIGYLRSRQDSAAAYRSYQASRRQIPQARSPSSDADDYYQAALKRSLSLMDSQNKKK